MGNGRQAETISNSVGDNGGIFWYKNANVKTVIELLNEVPGHEGGTKNRPLDRPGKSDLVQAIHRFQQHHFGVSNGRIDPGNVSMSTLNKYRTGSYSGPVTTRLSQNTIAALTKIARQKTVDSARKMLGKVSNRAVGAKPKVREGWRELHTIFQGAGLNVQPVSSNGQPPRKGLTIQLDEFKAAPGVPGGKGTYPGGLRWCGIFATWALNQAGFNVKWVYDRLEQGIYFSNDRSVSKPKYSSKSVVSIGDICIVNDAKSEAIQPGNPSGYLWHHVIVASQPNEQGNYKVIEGNFPDRSGYYQCIVDEKTRMGGGMRNVKDILFTYNIYKQVRSL